MNPFELGGMLERALPSLHQAGKTSGDFRPMGVHLITAMTSGVEDAESAA